MQVKKDAIFVNKKPRLSLTLNLMLTLKFACYKHDDIFHCLYEGKFLVRSRQARVGPALLGQSLCSLQPEFKAS